MLNLYYQPVETRFQHLYETMKSERFLEMKGLGNEVPFFIFPYKPIEEEEISRMCRHLKNKLITDGIEVLEINLYKLALSLLEERGLLNQILEEEKRMGKDQLLEDLQGLLNPESRMIPAIGELIEHNHCQILFLTGVGALFPFIRSHTILNNLQSTAKDFPTVMWFPGEYTTTVAGGSSLDLFGTLRDDKYYRAFNILDYQT